MHSLAMEQRSKIKTVPSSNTPNTAYPAAASSTTSNPYARDPTRRAIACVTCAKAKTRCDKGLPSCSRCITKGLKCSPRSTRRTSEPTYRNSPTKKTLAAPPRPGTLPSSTRPRSIMRAPSHIDFRTAVKMSQQAALISSAPSLTPLPTYHAQVEECYAYPQPGDRFTPELRYSPDADEFAFSRGATPQTPADAFLSVEGLPALDALDADLDLDMPYLGAWPAALDPSLGPVGLGFPVPMEHWTPEPMQSQSGEGFVPLWDGALDSGVVMQGEWAQLQSQALSLSQPQPQSVSLSLAQQQQQSLSHHQQQQQQQPQQQQQQQQQLRRDGFIDMGLVTSVPYVPKVQGGKGGKGVWEDVFMAGGLAY